MTWQPVDCHAHTTFSDGALEMGALVARVRARGVRPGIADHVSRDVASSVKTVDRAREYIAAMERFDGIARGAEFCWHDALWREMPDELLGRLTHRIGSLHSIFLDDGRTLNLWSRSLPGGLTRDAYLEMHVSNIERFAREMPVDILAHPTLVALPLRAIPGEELWTEALEERVVRALAAAGIAFELSARYRPHERLVRRAHDAGVRFSLGSDGHAEEQVGDLGAPLALARAVGVPDESLFDPWRHARTRAA